MAGGLSRLGRRCCWNCAVLYGLFLGWMYAGLSSGVSQFSPPKLDLEGPYLDIPANSTLRITCTGRHPLLWSLPETGDNVSLRSSITEERVQGFRSYKSTFELNATDVMDLGLYSCYYLGTRDHTNTGNVTSIYVFVNDDYYLFQPDKHLDQLIFVSVKHGERMVVPCLPTHSKAQVQLWKAEFEDERELVPLVPQYVEFDPTQGFIIYYPHSYYSGHFRCNGSVPGRTYVSNDISVVFVYLAPVDVAPNVMIEKESNFHPVLNASFTLNCTITVEVGVMVIMAWDYPDKNSSRITVTKPVRRDKQIGNERFVFSVITSQLTVHNVQRSDEGVYTCSCTDHAPRTYNRSLLVSVYESEQLAHVNLTTDLNTSQVMTSMRGGSFKIVVTAQAHPSFEDVIFSWRKDGRDLVENGDVTLIRKDPQVILEKKGAHFDDSGKYTLYARIGNATSKITVTVDVASEPIVEIFNNTSVYQRGSNYTLVCNVRGTPPISAQWGWKQCSDPNTCEETGMHGVFKVVAQGFKNDNGPLQEFHAGDSGARRRNVTLKVRAMESGVYRCLASNSLGTGQEKAPFYVTDARNGFEIVASDTMPVEQDHVKLSCLASQFIYNEVRWKWKPRGTSTFSDIDDSNGTMQLVKAFTSFSHSSTLIFDSVLRNQSGEYECYAYVKGSRKQRRRAFVVMTVRAIKMPEFNKTNLHGSVMRDVAYIELYCTATGVPEPRISWNKDGKPLNMTDIERLNDGTWLIKRKVTPQDAGNYQCKAENRGGAIYDNVDIVFTTGLSTAQIAIISGTSIAAAIFIGMLFCLLKRWYEDRKQEKELDFVRKTLFDKGQVEMFNPDLPLSDQVELLPYDHRWEFPKDRLKLGRTLGQGAFGRVVKAEAIGLGDHGQSLTVAVKMLKERADTAQRKALMAELKILIHLGRHLNIVNILGAVTKNVTKGELMVIVEYCKFGNLRHYLLRHRERFVNQLNPETGKVDPDMCYGPNSPSVFSVRSATSPLAVSNPVYCQQTLKYADLALSPSPTSQGYEFTFPSSQDGETGARTFPLPESGNTALMSGSSLRDHGDFRDSALTTGDLLCYAFQCARGMEYLATKKLIHRDLAARNVLLTEENVVKICDFGLAKDCYKYSNYVKKGDGLLPVKWTAIESIMDRVFTTKSDVWSYGVLLWEIFSLGGNPYPGVAIDESFYKRLKNGYRMDKPDYAPDDVYEVMQSCWQAEPKERPDFSALVTKLGDLLQASVRDYYMSLNEPYMNINQLIKNNNDYLSMENKPEADYLDMKSDDENYINTKNRVPVDAPTNYANVTGGDAGSIELAPMIRRDKNLSPEEDATGYSNVQGKLKLQIPERSREPSPPRSPGFDSRSDDIADISATPPPAYSLVVSVDGATEQLSVL